jgi:hypothetical protein
MNETPRNADGLQPDSDTGSPQDETMESERRRRIATEAYYNAQRRGFAEGSELEDWLEAELRIDGQASEKGPKGEAAAGQADGRTGGDGVSGGPSHAPDRSDAPASDQQSDAERIEPNEVKQWARQLDVSAPRLREAIKRVGPVVRDVKQFLASSPPS